MSRDAQSADANAAGALRWHRPAVFLAALALTAWIAGPALEGEFLSDDHFYIVNNPYVHSLSAENVATILDPVGPAAALTLNYAPLHLFAHALEWQVFGRNEMLGWHLVNVLLHAVCTLLLLLLLERSGIPPLAAAAGAVVFAVHPANVETVAWIFQLKTLLALALALGALLAHPRRPLLALLLFAAAILTKIAALFALPTLAAWMWVHAGPRHVRPGWLAAWAVAAIAVAIPEFLAFQTQIDERLDFAGGAAEQARTIVAIGMRYLVMAATSIGIGVFQEPAPAESFFDPWWLTGLAVLSALGIRTLWALRERREEAIYWVLAAAAFAPVSQIFPFTFPVADRYLYTILPGLIGGTLLALRPHFDAASRRFGGVELRRVAVIAAIALISAGAIRGRAHAAGYASTAAMTRASALAYPQGLNAALLRAETAAARGDGSAAARAIERAVELGFSDLPTLLRSPQLMPVFGHPEFAEALAALAQRDVALLSERDDLFPFQRIRLAVAYNFLGHAPEAAAVLEAGLAEAGPFEPVMRALRQGITDAADRR